MRFNRVEGLSLGLRGQLRPRTPLGPLSLTATTRLGYADLHLNGRVDIEHESVERRIQLSGYHELAAIEEPARHLGPANSLNGLLRGRDDGDYYRRTGATLEWTPPSALPREFRLRVFAEYHESVANETNDQLPRLWEDERAFRPNLVAEERWDVGASVELTSRWGTDPTLASQAVRASGLATDRYWRASFGYETRYPLPARSSLTLTAEAGGAGGVVPAQRLWYLGGPLTLHGYGPRALAGKRFYRGRAELARRFSFGRLVLFVDGGWAAGVGPEEALAAVGAGAGVLDGLIRFDVARQLESPHDYRLDIYLDQIL